MGNSPEEELVGALPPDWEYTTLGEICSRGNGDVQTGPFGSQLHAADYVSYGIPSIMPQNIGDNRISQTGIALITVQDAERLHRYRVRPGDIVYSRRGDVEKRALIRNAENGWLCGTGCLRIRFGDGHIDPVFASHYLGDPRVREWIIRHAHGATMPNLNTTILSALPFIVPPLQEQQAIASILGALDDKIDLNRRMNETLEAMARAIFKDWFVDFGPVRAKAEGRPPYLAPELWSLFPDALDDDDKPVGCGERRVGDILELKYGKALPATQRNDGQIPVYGSGGITGLHNVGLHSGPSIVVGRKGTVGSLYWIDGPFYPIDTVFFVVSSIGMTYCFYMLETLGLDGMNTDAAVPGLNRENVYRLIVPWSSDAVQSAFDAQAIPLRAKMLSIKDEISNLAQLRDLLLPKLMSGEIRLRDAEKAVENAI